MAKPGPQKINRYGDAFKLQAVQMSNVPGVLIKDVAESLCIHPFMLSKWRKQVRDGVLTGKPPPIDVAAVGELQRLRELERQHKLLQVEHAILKKANDLDRVGRRPSRDVLGVPFASHGFE